MKVFTSEKQKIGETGENIAAIYVTARGFSILERNYTRKWGELDIVAIKDNIIHFIEVKTVSRESIYRPEENMHRAKSVRLKRVIQTYLAEYVGQRDEYVSDPDWQFDLVCIYLDQSKKRAQVRYMENLIL